MLGNSKKRRYVGHGLLQFKKNGGTLESFSIILK
jgi:hypothetical protein